MKREREIALLLDDVFDRGLTRREAMRRAAAIGLATPAFMTLVARAQLAQARQGATPSASPVAVTGPPVAEQIPSTRTFGGREIVDPYAWLEDPTDPRVIAYLEAENAYADSVLGPTRDLQDTLYDEFINRIPQTDSSVPFRIDDWYYYARIEEGQDYEIIARREGSMDAEEEILLDLNQIAGEFLSLWAWVPSPDHRYLAYSINETGGIDYSLYVLDTTTGELLPDEVGLVDSFAWGNDSNTLVYTRPDETLRPFEVLTHALGADPADDALLFTESDEIYGVYLFKSNDRRYVFITSYSYGTTEAQYIDADGPDFAPQMLAARREGIEAFPDHGSDGFLLLTNEDAIDFKLVALPDDEVASGGWTDLIPAMEGRYIDGFDVLSDYMGVYGRENGFSQVWIHTVADGSLAPVTFDEAVYTAGAGTNLTYDATTLQVTYTPSSPRTRSTRSISRPVRAKFSSRTRCWMATIRRTT